MAGIRERKKNFRVENEQLGVPASAGKSSMRRALRNSSNRLLCATPNRLKPGLQTLRRECVGCRMLRCPTGNACFSHLDFAQLLAGCEHEPCKNFFVTFFLFNYWLSRQTLYPTLPSCGSRPMAMTQTRRLWMHHWLRWTSHYAEHADCGGSIKLRPTSR